ncbi:MAG: anthranilate/aminodeoxychorismate synthase component II [Actinobacteria bacterium QS_5_72_10]|nr:MAG: anthranilate/aminodeoxychorismate synthase component II [Actinobacteria bacterium QS_8_72_14]PSO54576.1 MAG: anthranilate/aminodeoxychorismate synthase component II [Actinobacteria bacterium QS_5_72_10]
MAKGRVFLIDNYDSFTYNLVQELGELGAEVEVARNDAVTVQGIADWQPDGIVISPGPGGPDDAGVSNDVVRRFAGGVPLLGVCLGHQCIAAVYGGAIVRASELVHGKTSEIHHDDAGVFAGLPNPFAATRYHSLILDEATCPGELAITARSSAGLVMGLRHHRLPVEGVQFHPESILTGSGMRLLSTFLDSLPVGRSAV